MSNNSIDFKRIDNDVNGNPRYVCHYLNLLTEVEKASTDPLFGDPYTLAMKRAKKIGGRRYHTKQYGGGIVFQSYNVEQTEKDIQISLTK